jgi:putative spermidine/putrescine transport system ATP-binding protein
MSDRVAVFDRGRIQQVGRPREIYEGPASRFVAGFVGTSNLLSGAAAQQLLGEDGTFTVRPEKIDLRREDAGAGDGDVAAPGTVAEVVYAGPVTRYLVDLDAGARLTTVLHNHGRSSDVAGRGDRVRASFARRDCRRLADDGPPEPTQENGTHERDDA